MPGPPSQELSPPQFSCSFNTSAALLMWQKVPRANPSSCSVPNKRLVIQCKSFLRTQEELSHLRCHRGSAMLNTSYDKVCCACLPTTYRTGSKAACSSLDAAILLPFLFIQYPPAVQKGPCLEPAASKLRENLAWIVLTVGHAYTRTHSQPLTLLVGLYLTFAVGCNCLRVSSLGQTRERQEQK